MCVHWLLYITKEWLMYAHKLDNYIQKNCDAKALAKLLFIKEDMNVRKSE